jgi:hypothetical protein
VAYAPINHLGISASVWNTNKLLDYHEYGRALPFGHIHEEQLKISGSMYDFAAGYFDKVGKKGSYEIYLGYGIGNIMNRTNGYHDPGDYSGNYQRITLQAAYGLDMKEIKFMFGMRGIYKYFNDFSIAPGAMQLILLLSMNSEMAHLCLFSPMSMRSWVPDSSG